MQVLEPRNIQRRRHFCDSSSKHVRCCTQPRPRGRFTDSNRAQRDVNPRQECLHPESHGDGYAGAATEPLASQTEGTEGARQRTHAPRRGCAWGRGVWTPAEASVECRVMSVATAAGADETCCAEQSDGAWGWDAVGYQIGHGESAARVAIILAKHKVHISAWRAAGRQL